MRARRVSVLWHACACVCCVSMFFSCWCVVCVCYASVRVRCVVCVRSCVCCAWPGAKVCASECDVACGVRCALRVVQVRVRYACAVACAACERASALVRERSCVCASVCL